MHKITRTHTRTHARTHARTHTHTLIIKNMHTLASVCLQQACSLIAGFLHYLFLTSFYWLLAEGLHIFASLTSRFHTSQTMPYVYIPLGYVTPALIVAGALFLSRQVTTKHSYFVLIGVFLFCFVF